ncbi:chorismate synthase [Tepiditoga spiralis]|uniref:Chorismate synthase n=1 Tax=Tepiditoga spiralis TaxID=2108365 RepID=A0A7G1GA66_9BACT|nr:chorismate synthase [Tepiditoga spiralis]BBE31012.1 chorismate synthase [Tepiditoga spiralis]
MNSFGTIFKVSIFGESHGVGVGVIIDGCPPGISLSKEDFIEDLRKRKSGTLGTTKRIEDDEPEFLSGIFKGKTTGAPITIFFKNKNIKSKDYDEFKNIPRPGHADFVAMKKYNNFNDYRGSGHFSGRLTLGLVAAGVIAKKIIKPICINAILIEVNGNKNIDEEIRRAIKLNDSVGGIVEVIGKNMMNGLGEPFFESVESKISSIIFSIPGIKGIEFGCGFNCTKMYGSQVNDAILNENGKTKTNNSGGINGGITNGNDLIFRVAVKPTSSISKIQETFNLKTKQMDNLQIKGRHDTCFALRVPVVLEAVTAIAITDFVLIKKGEE